MKLIAKKPCSFGGKQFFVGDEIPTELVSDPTAQEKRKVISIIPFDSEIVSGMVPIDDCAPAVVEGLPVSIRSKSGDIKLSLTADCLQAFVDVLMANNTSAVEIVNGITNEDLLILIHATDSRKTVREAAEGRAKALNPEAGEQ